MRARGRFRWLLRRPPLRPSCRDVLREKLKRDWSAVSPAIRDAYERFRQTFWDAWIRVRARGEFIFVLFYVALPFTAIYVLWFFMTFGRLHTASFRELAPALFSLPFCGFLIGRALWRALERTYRRRSDSEDMRRERAAAEFVRRRADGLRGCLKEFFGFGVQYGAVWAGLFFPLNQAVFLSFRNLFLSSGSFVHQIACGRTPEDMDKTLEFSRMAKEFCQTTLLWGPVLMLAAGLCAGSFGGLFAWWFARFGPGSKPPFVDEAISAKPESDPARR